MSERPPLWVAVTGKGGAGKSVLSGTLARIFARRGHKVLALDSDPMPGLAFSLGAEEPATPPLKDAARDPRERRHWLKPGIGPVRAIQRYSTEAPDGVRLLTLGKANKEGLAEIQPAILAYYEVVARLPQAKSFREWALVADLPAGPRQVSSGFAACVSTYLIVVQPTWQSALAARRVARVAAHYPGAEVRFVASQVGGASDRRHVERMIEQPLLGSIPRDAAVATAERDGVALLDAAPRSKAVKAIERLADELAGP